MRAAAAEGLDEGVLRARAGLGDELDDPEARVPLVSLYALIEACAERDPLVHLRMVERVAPDALDALGFLFLTSATLGDGLRAMVRYQRVWAEGERYELEEEGDVARLVYVPWGPPRAAHRWLAEMFAADILGHGARVLRSPLEGRVRLAHRENESAGELARRLGAPVELGAGRNELVLSRRALALPLGAPGQAAMAEFFARHLDARMAALPPETLAGRVLDALLTSHDGEAELGALARRLRMSGRTLQRRLEQEGTSLRALADEARRTRALALIEGGASIAEIAYVLGYSEPSAFHRAFRRWTGRTPEAFRAARSSSARSDHGSPRPART